MNQWTYEDMYKWYTKQGKVKDPLYEIVYSVIYDAKKPSKKDLSKVEPFIKRNIIYVGESPVQDANIFPNNLYIAYDDNLSDKKWLYFIHPKHDICEGNDTLFADHLSFVIDSTDKIKPCHFHTTKYYCVSGFTKWEYKTDHVKDHIPDKLNLNDDFTELFKKNSGLKNLIENIMKFPWQNNNGGTRRRNKTINSQTARNIMNQTFCSLWEEKKIQNITVFGFRLKDEIIFSVKIITKGKLLNSRLYPAIIFKTKVFNEEEFQEYLANTIPTIGI
jgi:hypothetical protein